MASPDTAAALLTANSIVIAAAAVIALRVVRLYDWIDENKTIWLIQLTGLAIVTLLSMSLFSSVGFLHAAEYSDGRFATWITARTLFNVAIGALLGAVYLFIIFLGILLHLQVHDLDYFD